MTRQALVKIREKYIKSIPYKMCLFSDFDYSVLDYIMYTTRTGRGNNDTFNDVIIMFDTETSKKEAGVIKDNHVVAWTMSIRAFDHNIVTLYGHKPSELVETMKRVHEKMQGDKTIMFCHNLAYDWIFIRKFCFLYFNEPCKQLNTKSHYPINIEFDNGIIFRDSLILAQRKLEKWAQDMDVEHKKAVGKWDYDKIRNQSDEFTQDELQYIECDTLAGVECIQKTMDALNKRIYSLPYTATGIPRLEVRERGKEHEAHRKFLRSCLTADQQIQAELTYHGGFTHANRDFVDTTITADEYGIVQCFDFSSSYPYCMLAEKYPCEKFMPHENCDLDLILQQSDDYAFMFKLTLFDVELKDWNTPMPMLQFSKSTKCINYVLDNGRILCADIVEIYVTEIDAKLIASMYKWSEVYCSDVLFSSKNYLPRWFTDYVYEQYQGKTMLKDIGDGNYDPVAYSIKKAGLNALYGLCVQKPVKDTINEDYVTGDYVPANLDFAEEYEKFTKKQGSILQYYTGIWVTCYAMAHLFELGACCSLWLYSDTDSCYGCGWDYDKVNAYNQKCVDKLKANGYGGVDFNGRTYYLGIAESEGDKDKYTEFRFMGAKRYCGRNLADGQLHITVAGVPKKTGAKCLDDDINNFRAGLVFDGLTTGKKTHTYLYVDKIYTDANGNETGDSIDLSPCDYLLDCIEVTKWEDIFKSEITQEVYE